MNQLGTPAPDASPTTGPDSLADTGGRAGLDLLLAAGFCLSLGLVGLGSGLVTRHRPGLRVRL
ncbi:MAG: hypothetical protein LBK42_03470 [Propionibacteriaceae bacterium]|nr:hypothetical protein [Propionibacteriaceae bacterium]